MREIADGTSVDSLFKGFTNVFIHTDMRQVRCY